MTIVCEPDELAKAAACYCGPSKLQQGEIVYLLQKISGDTSTPSELAKKAACYCFPEKVWRAVVAYLLCQTVNGGAACASQSGTTDPGGVVTPAFIGQLYHNTTADTYFYSTGLTSADWTAISGGSPCLLSTIPVGNQNQIGLQMIAASGPITTVGYSGSTNIGGIQLNTFGNGGSFDTFSAPNLVSIDPSYLVGVGLLLGGDNFTTIDTPLLSFIGGQLIIESPVITTASFPSLVTIVAGVGIFNCTMLTSLSLPVWVPTDGTALDFHANALNATSVELILRRCVLAGVTTCTIDLAGGTNAGLASLSAQGQADAVTLGAQLTVNP